MSPETTYISALFAVMALIVWALAVDVTLAVRHEQTISAWLRSHPLWALWPISITLVLVSALIIHLFIVT